MRSKNILVGYAGCLGVITVLALQVSAQVRQAEKLGRRPNQTGELKKGNSGKQHGERKPETEPVVDHWTLGLRGTGAKVGTANVTLNPNGSWRFSGQTKPRDLAGCEFNIVFAVKSSEGTVIAFKHSGDLSPGKPRSFSWHKQGRNPVIKDNFKAFAKDHDWYGTWSCEGGANIQSLVNEITSGLGSPIIGTLLF